MENIHEEMPSSRNKVLCLIHLLSIFCDPAYGEAGTDNSNIYNEDRRMGKQTLLFQTHAEEEATWRWEMSG